VAQKLKEFDPSMTLVMENIGIHYSAAVPNFLKEAIVNEVNAGRRSLDMRTRGLIETRKGR
jgi:hypothetical protein